MSLVEPTGVQARKLYPVDEASRDRSLLHFRRRLIQAVRKHDRRFILSILDPKILNTYGEGGEGIQDFKATWELDRPESGLWTVLGTILSLGGTIETTGGRRMFCAPYVFRCFPDDLDVDQYQAVIARNVKVRSQPKRSAPIVDTLSYDIVRVSPVAPPKHDLKGVTYVSDLMSGRFAWVRVVTPRGRRGYVQGQFVRDAIDYRACFEKQRGRWRMTVLVAGD